jgi:hypothetical protein
MKPKTYFPFIYLLIWFTANFEIFWPYQFFASLFGAPWNKKEQKHLLRPGFGAFLTLGPRVVWIPRWNGTKKPVGAPLFGTSIFKFWVLTLSGDHGLFGALRWNTETGKKNVWGEWGPRFFFFWGTVGLFGAPHCNRERKNRLGPRSLGPRFLKFGASRFLGNLDSLGSRTGALFGPRDETGNRNFGKHRRE